MQRVFQWKKQARGSVHYLDCILQDPVARGSSRRLVKNTTAALLPASQAFERRLNTRVQRVGLISEFSFSKPFPKKDPYKAAGFSMHPS